MPSDRSSKLDRRDLLACAVLSLLWLAPLPLIGIHGDFPLNDDFTYALTTQKFLETGHFEPKRWAFAPIYTNVALGVVFSSLFGFSRISIIGVWRLRASA